MNAIVNESIDTPFGNATRVKLLGKGVYANVIKYQFGNITAAIKHFHPHDEGISNDAVRELHAMTVLQNCPHILQSIAINISLLRNGHTDLAIMTADYTGTLNDFCNTISQVDRVTNYGRIFDQLLTGLYYMHTRGLVHLDIKPENILINFDYNKSTGALANSVACVIADFGLTRQLLHCRSCESNSELVTPTYRPPELMTGNVFNNKADIWSLGMVMLWYLTHKTLIRLPPKDYEDNGLLFEAILLHLQHPLKYVRDISEDCMNKGELTGRIAVGKQLKLTLLPGLIKLIPNEYLVKLKYMLQLRNKDRPSVVDLVNNLSLSSIIPAVLLPARCKIKEESISHSSTIRLLHVYESYRWLIVTGMFYRYANETILAALDMMGRYLAHELVKDKRELNLIAIGCLSLCSKMFEDYTTSMEEWYYACSGVYSSRQIIEKELILYKFNNFTIATNELDPVLKVMGDWVRFQRMLRKLADGRIDIGTLGYNDIADKYIRTN